MSTSDLWDEETARRYDSVCAEMFAPDVLDPAVAFLADLADDGPALELAVGTGRVAVPLAERGIPVTGIELSAPMAAQLHRKVSPATIPVVVDDMATASAARDDFALVYVVWNSLGNVRTQDEQVAVFANAARHLRPGGRFVVELGVPQLRRLPPGQQAVPFDVSDDHVGLDTYDPVTQQATSHHFSREADGTTYRYGVSNFRYVWPSELDLMARLAGMTLEARYADWRRSSFTAESPGHVSVWQLPGSMG
ncbi:class I SAM-dependent DNA methyltransferase [Nocardioides coralli]|uniref:class I SAM-dependent DNA methyltransferase n=1 Tax=Nocardioides coralli TaxID=2872154 RepID=UPI001CA40C7E|nr:class I SAM-dependent methyltransferase [Nocardioides coralli]QZY29790.1 class I SAM-dependent methyltransferase [Nocardioides coralli]